MTSVFNGNRFVYVAPLFLENLLLEYISALDYVFYFGQSKYEKKFLCSNCWGIDHTMTNCKNNPKGQVCLEQDHSSGDPK
uniref:Uncharacterized protein n=1 Tax=Magallana gigas TaxID=29159 RepID=K1PIZ9_MAGGI